MEDGSDSDVTYVSEENSFENTSRTQNVVENDSHLTNLSILSQARTAIAKHLCRQEFMVKEKVLYFRRVLSSTPIRTAKKYDSASKMRKQLEYIDKEIEQYEELTQQFTQESSPLPSSNYPTAGEESVMNIESCKFPSIDLTGDINAIETLKKVADVNEKCFEKILKERLDEPVKDTFADFSESLLTNTNFISSGSKDSGISETPCEPLTSKRSSTEKYETIKKRLRNSYIQCTVEPHFVPNTIKNQRSTSESSRTKKKKLKCTDVLSKDNCEFPLPNSTSELLYKSDSAVFNNLKTIKDTRKNIKSNVKDIYFKKPPEAAVDVLECSLALKGDKTNILNVGSDFNRGDVETNSVLETEKISSGAQNINSYDYQTEAENLFQSLHISDVADENVNYTENDLTALEILNKARNVTKLFHALQVQIIKNLRELGRKATELSKHKQTDDEETDCFNKGDDLHRLAIISEILGEEYDRRFNRESEMCEDPSGDCEVDEPKKLPDWRKYLHKYE